MPSNSNLNVKFGDKIGTGNSVPTNIAASSTTAGNIYAAKNSVGEIEMYIDTPIDTNHGTTARKRLDPRIYVGSANDIIGDTTGLTQEQINQRQATAISNIWDNYDVWIDTSGDPTGAATPGVSVQTSTMGLMGKQTIYGLSEILNQLKNLKLQIVSESYWNTSSNAYGSSGGNNLANRLTIVLPDSAVPSGQTASNYRPVDIDFSGISITSTGGSNS